jgi:uncharacterized protein YndB with AHSA1/START domain
MTTTSTPTDLQFVVHTAAPPAAVYAALTTPEGISGWWGPAEGDATEGGTLTMRFSEHGAKGLRVEDAAPAARVAWAVRWSQCSPEWAGTRITFDLIPSGDGTEVRFRHEGLTPDLECYEACDSGWAHFLASLVAFVERGVGSPHRAAA